jgi:hypothetical protein
MSRRETYSFLGIVIGQIPAPAALWQGPRAHVRNSRKIRQFRLEPKDIMIVIGRDDASSFSCRQYHLLQHINGLGNVVTDEACVHNIERPLFILACRDGWLPRKASSFGHASLKETGSRRARRFCPPEWAP